MKQQPFQAQPGKRHELSAEGGVYRSRVIVHLEGEGRRGLIEDLINSSSAEKNRLEEKCIEALREAKKDYMNLLDTLVDRPTTSPKIQEALPDLRENRMNLRTKVLAILIQALQTDDTLSPLKLLKAVFTLEEADEFFKHLLLTIVKR